MTLSSQKIQCSSSPPATFGCSSTNQARFVALSADDKFPLNRSASHPPRGIAVAYDHLGITETVGSQSWSPGSSPTSTAIPAKSIWQRRWATSGLKETLSRDVTSETASVVCWRTLQYRYFARPYLPASCRHCTLPIGDRRGRGLRCCIRGAKHRLRAKFGTWVFSQSYVFLAGQNLPCLLLRVRL